MSDPGLPSQTKPRRASDGVFAIEPRERIRLDAHSNRGEQLAPLVDQLVMSQGLTPSRARHLIEEVLAYFDESVDAYVRRRHRELQFSGLKNDRIYDLIVAEVGEWRFPASGLSVRQVRRIIYG